MTRQLLLIIQIYHDVAARVKPGADHCPEIAHREVYRNKVISITTKHPKSW